MGVKELVKRVSGLSNDRYSMSELLIYIAAWGIVFLFPVVENLFTPSAGEMESHYWRDVLNIWLLDVPFLALFILNNRIIYPWLNSSRRMAVYIVCAVLLTVIVMGGVSLYDSPALGRHGVFPPASTERPEGLRPMPWQERRDLGAEREKRQELQVRPPMMRREKASPVLLFMHGPFVVRVLIALLMLSFNIAVKLYYKSLRDKAAMWKLRWNNMQTELDYLKYQINPHFFMNTLNNIHALVEIDAGKAQRMIVEFSNLMRYLLYETDSRLILLSKELQFLRNYVELMRIRFTESVHINVCLPDDAGDVQVPPLLFISFVENAFKHGTSQREAARIDIGLQVTDGGVVFECANSNFGEGADQYHGIGLENIRKRLQLIYGERYRLDIAETVETFKVTLTVPVNRRKREKGKE